MSSIRNNAGSHSPVCRRCHGERVGITADGCKRALDAVADGDVVSREARHGLVELEREDDRIRVRDTCIWCYRDSRRGAIARHRSAARFVAIRRSVLSRVRGHCGGHGAISGWSHQQRVGVAINRFERALRAIRHGDVTRVEANDRLVELEREEYRRRICRTAVGRDLYLRRDGVEDELHVVPVAAGGDETHRHARTEEVIDHIPRQAACDWVGAVIANEQETRSGCDRNGLQLVEVEHDVLVEHDRPRDVNQIVAR